MSTSGNTRSGHIPFSLEPGEGPFYRQLMEQIQQAINQGLLQPGDRLPGSRAMAHMLGVSRSTLVSTYERLIAEGILISRPKSGVFVADQPQTAIALPRPVVTQPSELLLAFDSGADPSVFPHKSWQKSLRASWRTPDPRILEDAYPFGYPGLQQAIADYLYQLRGLQCSPEQVLITAGNRDSLTLLRHAFRLISPASQWLTENPSYPPIRRLLANWATNDQVRFLLPLDAEGCMLPSLDAQASPPIVVLTPNRQYPSGIALGSQRRQQWLQRLQEQSIWVVEDDYDNDFCFQGRTGVPLMQADRSERVFFVGSLSKVLFRGLRLGFIVAPRTHMPALRQSRIQLGGAAALPMQPVVTDFMNSGEFGRHINRMRRHYRHKRDHLLTLLEQYLSCWFEWQVPQGGMHLIIRFTSETTTRLHALLGDGPLDQQLATQLRQDGIKLEPLSTYYAAWEEQLLQQPDDALIPTAGFILGYTRPDEDNMRTLLHTLATRLSALLD